VVIVRLKVYGKAGRYTAATNPKGCSRVSAFDFVQS